MYTPDYRDTKIRLLEERVDRLEQQLFQLLSEWNRLGGTYIVPYPPAHRVFPNGWQIECGGNNKES